MSSPFLAEIRIFCGNFPPTGWAFCNGQILPIAQNTALFSLLGTTYGGDGRTNFALPNLQGNMPMGAGNGPGLTPRVLGETGGASTHTLLAAQMPSHTHAVQTASAADSLQPSPTALLAHSSGNASLYHTPTNPAAMAASAVQASGAGWAHNNMPPVLGLTFIIALQGIFPARS